MTDTNPDTLSFISSGYRGNEQIVILIERT